MREWGTEWGSEVEPEGQGWSRPGLVPAPDVDKLGLCTECGEPEEAHVTGGVVSVREFHRAGAGGRYSDEVE
ncbi:hypothetical protein SAMN05421805_103145 [Saccharopolyspora antimicrobica]|uniref:Uncharacterized protein n=1 Tax=Saccharopolyspora antimicrobica TaxID=455193 RepID=A0A1I4WYF0_9PSEU|nr:hypothetical protein ATL45_2529 [Saccharopolyspora antimicrobica]SFN18774.1 hypothetical protein SAMN05421805_103145 [Saccharopolyspora antimicrobica]